MGRPKKSATAAAARGQNTLSFSGKITKPSAATSRLGKSLDEKTVKRAGSVSVTPDSRPSTPAEAEVPSKALADHKLALRQQPLAAPAENPEPLSLEEEEALKLSEARVKKYWKEKEDARIFPRVHQGALPLHDKILREFDLSTQYGPSIGIPRTRRWNRANKLGLKPPLEVLAVLIKSEAPADAREKSQVDALMQSTV